MRVMMQWTVPVAAGNAAIKSGAMQTSVESMLRDLQPEAAYFFAHGGQRGGLVVFDMADPTQIPLVAEPLFQALDAAVEIVPVMSGDDLKKAFATLVQQR